MASNDQPPRPPWFRELPKEKSGEEPPPASSSEDSELPKEKSGEEPPPASSSEDPELPKEKSGEEPPSASSSEDSASRFPSKPEPDLSQSSPPVSEGRQASLEARMLALEHDYAQSTESWRKSSLALVRALEMLEGQVDSTVYNDASQPFGSKSASELSDEFASLRDEIAQMRARLDGVLPLGGGMRGKGGQPASRSFTYEPLARRQRHAGRTILSLLVTATAILCAWLLASHIDTMRDGDLRASANRALGIDLAGGSHRLPRGNFVQPSADGSTQLTSLEHYQKALAFYRGARGLPDMTRAAQHFDAAASRGMAAAQFWLGHLHENGLGIEASPTRAAQLYERAAASGHIKAMHNLGVLYLEGRGVVPDAASARLWLVRASGYGSSESMNLLGRINEQGMLGQRNLKSAYAWYRLAAQMGHRAAQEHAPRIVARLSSPARREAEALVTGWRIKDADPIVNGEMTGGSDQASPPPPRSAAEQPAVPHYVAPPRPRQGLR